MTNVMTLILVSRNYNIVNFACHRGAIWYLKNDNFENYKKFAKKGNRYAVLADALDFYTSLRYLSAENVKVCQYNSLSYKIIKNRLY